MKNPKNEEEKRLLPHQVCAYINFASAYDKNKSKGKKDTRYRTE